MRPMVAATPPKFVGQVKGARQRADEEEGPRVSCVPVSGFDGGGGAGVVVISLTV